MVNRMSANSPRGASGRRSPPRPAGTAPPARHRGRRRRREPATRDRPGRTSESEGGAEAPRQQRAVARWQDQRRPVGRDLDRGEPRAGQVVHGVAQLLDRRRGSRMVRLSPNPQPVATAARSVPMPVCVAWAPVSPYRSLSSTAMVRLAGAAAAMMARAPSAISCSPSPVTTSTGRSGWASARPKPTIAAAPIEPHSGRSRSQSPAAATSHDVPPRPATQTSPRRSASSARTARRRSTITPPP